MSESYPSREAVSADVPDPEELTAKFVYNFFVPDEGTSDTGNQGPKRPMTRASGGHRHPVIQAISNTGNHLHRLRVPQATSDTGNQ